MGKGKGKGLGKEGACPESLKERVNGRPSLPVSLKEGYRRIRLTLNLKNSLKERFSELKGKLKEG